MFLNKIRKIFLSWTQNLCLQQMFCAQGNICVGNNVSLFARAITAIVQSFRRTKAIISSFDYPTPSGCKDRVGKRDWLASRYQMWMCISPSWSTVTKSCLPYHTHTHTLLVRLSLVEPTMIWKISELWYSSLMVLISWKVWWHFSSRGASWTIKDDISVAAIQHPMERECTWNLLGWRQSVEG